MNRQEAAEMSLLAPKSVRVGRYDVRVMSGGDMLICSRLGLVLASGDVEAINGMSKADQMAELLQIGALLCHSPEELKGGLWGMSAEGMRKAFLEPVLFSLTVAETSELLSYVARFFSAANEVSVQVEEQPTGTKGPDPAGK